MKPHQIGDEIDGRLNIESLTNLALLDSDAHRRFSIFKALNVRYEETPTTYTRHVIERTYL